MPVVPFITIGKNLSGTGENYAFGTELGLSDHFSATIGHQIYRGTLQTQRDIRIGIAWNLLPNAARFERRSASNQQPNAAGVVGEMLGNSVYRIAPLGSQGQIKTTLSDVKKVAQDVRDVAKPKPVTSEEEKPKPPVNPEIPDTVAPTLSLSGASTMSITVGGTYAELGATCTDDKDATCTVVTTGTVDTSTVGTYTITYTATDTAGNTSTLTRTVNVVAVADSAPIVGGAFASLSDMMVSDELGSAPITINAG